MDIVYSILTCPLFLPFAGKCFNLHFSSIDLAVWWQHWMGSVFACWARLSWFHAI